MSNPLPSPTRSPGFAHGILERLTAAKTHVWLLRKRIRGGQVDPAEVEGSLDRIERHIDDAALLAVNLQGQSSPPP